MHERILLLPTTNQRRAYLLDFLGGICLQCYEITQVKDDLHQSVWAYGDAVRDDPGVVIYLARYANTLWVRFEHLGDLLDIEKAMEISKAALELSPNTCSVLVTLGNCLLSRCQRLGNIGDLNEAISMFKKALLYVPRHLPSDMAIYSQNLANSLCLRFDRLGNLSDINESLSLSQEAFKILPAGHPWKAKCLTNVGISLQARFQYLGDLGDLNHSLSVLSEAVRLSPTGDDKSFCYSALTDCLEARFKRLGKLDDLHNSILMSKEALASCPGDSHQRSIYLNAFGLALMQRFNRRNALEDLEDAIVAFKDAASITFGNDYQKATWLTNLGNALKALFFRSGNLSHINDDISAFNDALGRRSDDDPRRVNLLVQFGSALLSRFSQFGDENDYEQAIAAISSAACSTIGPASKRFTAAETWARIDLSLEICPESMSAYTIALNLLPQLSWLGLSISDRYHYMVTARQLTRSAVGTAIAAEQYTTAVEWSEQCRSVIWSQILKLRTPVDALKQSHPDLAARFVLLSRQLEDAGTRDTSPRPFLTPQHRYHDAAHARDLLLKEIRALDNFDRFLLPKNMTDLGLAAQRGPVVILSVSEMQVAALVLMPGLDEEVLHIPLPEFNMIIAEVLGKSFRSLLRDAGRGERLVGRREGNIAPEAEFAGILAMLWKWVAKPVLAGLGYSTPPRAPQRIWWCLTGPLTFLPIHAAGLYGEEDGFGSKLSDFVVSSYTPSLTALVEAFRAGSDSPALQILAVAQPSANGQSYIPGTQREIDKIQQLAQDRTPNIPVVRLYGNAATLDNVREGMTTSRWVHFACHGVQNVSNPIESALLLAGSSKLTLSNIAKMSIPHADLMFLSACHTGTGAEDLEEESVHLAAGMLTAGYRSVIATMWSIMDDDAPNVAADVYEHLFKTSPPDPTRAAEALHLAVRKLQDRNKSFFHWVPFIHVGA
ncbi:CHAT domain-containing protein [Mycena capillaripes]|nr:CHAT domain-containing protein [Mycena capillaripes]